MALDNALFLVNRAGATYHSKGSDIGSRMVAGDSVLVQRNGQRFRATFDGSAWTKIQDSDLLLAWDGTNNRRVTGANFKALFVKEKPSLQGFDIEPHRSSYVYDSLISATFINMKPGYDEQDYIQFFKTISTNSSGAEAFLTPRPERPYWEATYPPHAANWRFDKLPVTSTRDVEVFLEFIDRETGVSEGTYSMTVTLRPRSQEEEE